MSRAQPHTESLPAKPPETSHRAHGRATHGPPDLAPFKKGGTHTSAKNVKFARDEFAKHQVK